MRPKTPKIVRRYTNDKVYNTPDNFVHRHIVHTLPYDSPPINWARTGARRRKSFPCSHRSFPVVDQRDMSDSFFRHFPQQDNWVCDCSSCREQRCCFHPSKQIITSLFLLFKSQSRFWVLPQRKSVQITPTGNLRFRGTQQLTHQRCRAPRTPQCMPLL